VIFQSREPSFANAEALFEFCELGAASRVWLAILDPREEECHGRSRFCDASSKGCRLDFCVCDRRTQGGLNERDPALIVVSIAPSRAKMKPLEAEHSSLPPWPISSGNKLLTKLLYISFRIDT
jgi:hypothetical protein